MQQKKRFITIEMHYVERLYHKIINSKNPLFNENASKITHISVGEN